MVKQWNLLFAAGLISFAGGVLALLNPMEATFAATRLLGSLFILSGVIQTAVIFGASDLWTALLGALAIESGVWIMGNPIWQGSAALARIIGALFLLEAAVKIVLAFAARGTPYFWILLLTGSVSGLLAGAILIGLVPAVPTMPGILLATDLIASGGAVILLALYLKPSRVA